MSKGIILVTGGCGYIGSHAIVDLIENGYDVVSVDNLSNATEKSIDGIAEITGKRVKNHIIDLADRPTTLAFFAENKFDGVIHFAAYKSVGESVQKPLTYFHNNINSLLNVIEGMENSGVDALIFSSSCSVYGNSKELPVTEKTPRQEAESPYGRTKQIGEDILADYCAGQTGFNAILLRYFNPAGAHKSALIGEAPTNPASTLVPVITETAIGKRQQMTVFGSDYPTRDGSCVRDYIHVMDLAHAHTLSIAHLLEQKNSENLALYNLGIGEGVTVLEAIRAFEKITDMKLNYNVGERRPGDVEAIYANAKKAENILGWKPSRNIEDIMQSAWDWEKVRTNG